MFLPAKSFAIYSNQFVFLHQKVNSISQRDTGINVFLNYGFITERRVVQCQAIVLFKQAYQ
ncbi:hypothetical protein A3N38_03240 [Enterobacter hormaechei subsp. steigerwaltii]|nr:hypothetical protein ABF56_05180 [Enterobacter hormaechei subsp. steigerwaltii]KZP48649.1 hypothetical protein A3N38_03240 [Enterobacter hormaechei subsp. steigerwaltii]